MEKLEEANETQALLASKNVSDGNVTLFSNVSFQRHRLKYLCIFIGVCASLSVAQKHRNVLSNTFSMAEVYTDDDNESMPIAKNAIFRLYKRTHFSIDARADASFLHEYFGMTVSDNYTYYDKQTGGIEKKETWVVKCAERLELGTLAFQFHLFTSYVTPTGKMQTREWVTYWRDMHHKSFRENKWNAFMSMRTTFYTTDLTPFYHRLANNGIPMLRIRYVNPLDGKVVYSIFVVIPNSGFLIEVISENLDLNAGKDFGEFPEGACRAANFVMQEMSSMRQQWKILKGVDNFEGTGLPSLLNVMNSFAATSVSNITEFFEVFDNSAPMKLQTSADVYDVDHGENFCAYVTIRMKLGETSKSVDHDVISDIRAVINPTAPVSGSNVAMWVEYVTEQHDYFTKFDGHGWDRYLDNHFGLYQESGAHLDALFPKVTEKKLAWHAHVGVKGHTIGSIWTSGLEAQGIEFHGNFTSKWADMLDELDYCSIDSSRHDIPGDDDMNDDGEYYEGGGQN